MSEDDFENFDRRVRLYHSAFEEYNSLHTTYQKFYEASDAYRKRGKFFTFSSTAFGGILLFIIGAVIVGNGPEWGTELAFGVSVVVASLSFINAVDSPQQMSNVAYNSGQTLQRVYLEFHYFVTVRLPDPEEDLDELEEEYMRLLERKHTVNETTPSIGGKWYRRVKEGDKSWKPKPLTEVTGEDGEFKFESDEETSRREKLKSYLLSPYRFVARSLGF